MGSNAGCQEAATLADGGGRALGPGGVRSMLHGYTLRRVIFAIVRRVGQQRERLLTDAAYARPCVAGAVVTLDVLIVINGAGGGEVYGDHYGRLAQWRRGRGHGLGLR